MLRGALRAFTRVFDALWRCAADPGSIGHCASAWVPALRCIVKNAAPRPGHGVQLLTPSQDEEEVLTVTFDDVREIALAWPEVTDGTSYGTPALKVRKKLL